MIRWFHQSLAKMPERLSSARPRGLLAPVFWAALCRTTGAPGGARRGVGVSFRGEVPLSAMIALSAVTSMPVGSNTPVPPIWKR